jgi:hypothetical protein
MKGTRMRFGHRHARIIFIIFGASLSILGGSCGTSQNEQSGGAGAAEAIPNNFTFSVIVDNPLTVIGSIAPGVQAVTASFLQFSGAQQKVINGTFDQGNRTWSLQADSEFPVLITPSGTPSQSFSLSITVVETIFTNSNLQPTNGALEFVDDAGDRIHVAFNNPSIGVDISLNGGSAESFNMTDFQNLFNSGALLWQQEAYLSFVAMEFILVSMQSVSGVIPSITTNETTLADMGTLSLPCDSLSGSSPPVTAPATVQDQGQETLVWVDLNGDSTVDTGDGFTITFTDCFEQAAEVILKDGFVKLLGFVHTIIDSSTTRIGFESTGDEAGGATFINTDIWLSTATDAGITFDGTTKMSVNGGFSLAFFQ